MRVQQIDVEVRSPHPPEELFERLLHPEGWPAWAPVDHGEVVTASPDGPGAVGEVRRFRSGRTVGTERIVTSERPHRFGYAMLSGIPVRDYRGDVHLDDDGVGGTRIRWRSTFRPAVPLTGTLARRRLEGFVRQVASGLASSGGPPA